MHNIILDEEIKNLLPTLDSKTYMSLEESIVHYGCMFPLVTWQHILIDGYNRYAICIKHDIPFYTIEKDFDSRDDVLIWVISNQVSRRNLTPMQLSYYRGMHYNKEKKRVNNPNGNNQHKVVESQNETQPQTTGTAALLAKQYDVSRNTILRDKDAALAIDAIGEASKEAKGMVLSGEAKIDKKELKRLSAAPDSEIRLIVDDILNGLYDKRNIFPDTPPVSPIGVTLASVQSIEAAIVKSFDLFDKHLLGIKRKTDKTRLKTQLGKCINALEELQKRV